MRKIYTTLLLCLISFYSFAVTWTIGTGVLTNSSTSYPTPYGNYWTSGHTQFLYLASELTAAGMTAGAIDKIAFNVSATNGMGSLVTYNIGMASTALTTLSTTTVPTTTYYSASNYTLSGTGWITTPFSSSFTWNGTSNIIVDVCWYNCPSGACTNYTSNGSVYQTATAYNSANALYSDGIASPCGGTSVSYTYTQRPNVQFTRNCAVIANPTNNSPLCVGQAVALTGTTTSAINWTWTGPGGFTSTLQNPTVPTGLAGVYTLTAGSATCSVTATTTITNLPPTAVNFVPTTPNVCQGSNITVTASDPSNTATFVWAASPALSCTNCANPTISPTATSTYTVTGTVGSCSLTNTVTVTVNAIPTASVSPTNPGVSCGSVVLTGSTDIGDSYQWYSQAGAIFGANTSTYTATTSGTYHVQVSKIATGCSQNSANVVVNINPLPTAVTSPSVNTTNCVSQTITATTDIGDAYQWYNQAGIITGANTNTYVATVTGTYYVQTKKTSTGCTNNSTPIVITINNAPTAGISTPGGVTSTCGNAPLVLTRVTDFGDTYQWYNTAGAIPGATNTTYTVTASDTFRVLVSKANTGCQQMSAKTYIAINSNPTAGITTPGGAVIACGSMILTGVTNFGDTYQWYKNGTALPGATQSTYTATASGTYMVNIQTASTTCNTNSSNLVLTINPNPSSTISEPNNAPTICGNSMLLTANTNIPVANAIFQWYGTSGLITGAIAQNYTASLTDYYSVVITNTVTGCYTQSTPTLITLNPFPTASINAPAGLNSCGNPVTLNALSDIGDTYQWYNSGGAITGATNQSYSALISDAYYVRVTRSATGCNTNSASANVLINTVPTATATAAGPVSFCQGSSVTLTANNGANLNYQWTLNGNDIPGATNINYVANGTGDYSVRVSTPANCNATSSTISVLVNLPPTATALPVGATSFCQGESVQLAAPVIAGYHYQWINGVNNIGGATSSSYVATASGSYSVHIVDGNGCSATSSQQVITVNPLPTASTTPNTPVGICPGNSTTIAANTGANLSYQWAQNGVAIYGATGNTYTTNMPGNYSVTEWTQYNCSDVSAAVNVSINPIPTPSIYQNGLTLYTTGSYSSYQWYYDYQPIAGATNSTYTVSQNGGYTLQVVDANGCNGASTQSIVQNVGVANVAGASDVNIYPNPNNGTFTINGNIASSDNKVDVEISDMSGRIIFRGTYNTNANVLNEKINLGEQAVAGMYIIKLKSDETNKTLPFVKN